MRGKIVLAGLILGLSGMVAAAQEQSNVVPPPATSTARAWSPRESVPQDTFVITGEQSNTKILFNEGDYVYINKGAAQGVKVGDEYLRVYPIPEGSLRYRMDKVAMCHPAENGNLLGRRRPRESSRLPGRMFPSDKSNTPAITSSVATFCCLSLNGPFLR